MGELRAHEAASLVPSSTPPEGQASQTKLEESGPSWALEAPYCSASGLGFVAEVQLTAASGCGAVQCNALQCGVGWGGRRLHAGWVVQKERG